MNNLLEIPRANPFACAAGLLGIVVTLAIKVDSLLWTGVLLASYVLILLGLFVAADPKGDS